MLRTQIDPSLSNLDNLNLIYPWIPNSQSIRPSSQNIERKMHLAQLIDLKWRSYKDYIFHTVFGERYYVDGEETGYTKFVNPKYFKYNHEWAFQPSMFPYDVKCDETNHWILWNSTKDFNYNFDIDIINKVIENHLSYHTILGDPFQFVWYKNPKPTIPEFYHIQVFWTSGINETNSHNFEYKQNLRDIPE